MLENFRKYFAGWFILTLLSLPLLRGAEIPAPVSKYYPVRFEDAKVSPRARMIVLVNTLRKDVANALPATSGKGVTPRKVSVYYEKGDPAKVFSMRKNRQGVCRITLPENCDEFLALPDGLTTLTAWMLASYAGKDPALAEHIRNSWYVTGIARKLLRGITPVKSPFTQYFPSAYVLTSIDKYPSLESLLSQELTGEDSCARLLYEEYSELLVLICMRNNLFRKGLLSLLLEKTAQDPGRKDMALFFQDFVIRHLGEGKNKGKRFFKTRLNSSSEIRTKDLLEQFFQQELEKLLNWSFLPASAVKLEKLYRKAITFEAVLKEKKEEKKETIRIAGGKQMKKNPPPETGKKMLRGTLHDLTRQYKRLANPADPSLKMALEVGRITRFASPDLQVALLGVRSALLAFSRKQSESTIRRLLKADLNFYGAVERNVLLEEFLERTEKTTLSPSARYYLTLALLRKSRFQELPTLRKLEVFHQRTFRERGNTP